MRIHLLIHVVAAASAIMPRIPAFSRRHSPVLSLQAPEAQRDLPVATEAGGFPIPVGSLEPTGSLLGAIALIAGTTVGAGILALPAKTFDAGFAPSAVTLLLCWAYMSASGLLIAEVNVNTLCALEKNAVSLDSMAEETLGQAGARVSGAAYVFIHYALLIAYMLQGGNLLIEYLAALGGASLPTVCGPPLFVLLAGGAVFASSEQQVETGNSLLFGGVLATFVALVALGAPNVDAELLARSDIGAVVPAVPIMVLSLVFHNVVPTVCYQLGCDLDKIRTAILAGSAIPTLMFILWNLVILGSVPPEAAAAAAASGGSAVFDPLEGLRASGDAFGSVVRAFSLCAILTSFIGFVLGLVDYFADALSGPLGIDTSLQAKEALSTAEAGTVEGREGGSAEAGARYTLVQKASLFACALLPPLATALYDPSLFFAALDNAGTFGILVLFGIIPAAMAWQQRYGGANDPYASDGDQLLAVSPMLPGGRLTLGLMAGGAAGIVALESYERLAGVIA